MLISVHQHNQLLPLHNVPLDGYTKIYFINTQLIRFFRVIRYVDICPMFFP